jgi:hypothetical protein
MKTVGLAYSYKIDGDRILVANARAADLASLPSHHSRNRVNGSQASSLNKARTVQQERTMQKDKIMSQQAIGEIAKAVVRRNIEEVQGGGDRSCSTSFFMTIF